MRNAIRHIVAHTYKPLLVRYLSKTRAYHYEDIKMEIPAGVFHPGFFFSTQLLLNYIKGLPLQGKKFFEPGCGSGLISIYAAKKGADVTASDINPIAIQALGKNTRHNDVSINVIQSDLFDKIPEQVFDIIAINPPYYKKRPQSAKDYAWYCGENGEYFSALFNGLKRYSNSKAEIVMVAFEGCDMELIAALALENGYKLNCILRKQNLLEKNCIYKILETER